MLLPQGVSHLDRKWYLLSLGAVLIVGIIAAVSIYIKDNQTNRQHIMDRIETVRVSISPETIASLSGSPDDLANPTYQNIKGYLERVSQANTDARFVYLIGKNTDGKLFFYADSEDPISVDYSPPGQIYGEASADMYAVMRDGISRVEGPSQDRWGLWISGYSAIRSPDGHILALVGMDLPAYRYLSNVLIYSFLPILIALFISILLVLGERARKREMQFLDQKSEFLAIASHEIRTPLTGVRWAVESILEDKSVSLPPKTHMILSLVHENTLSLISRINNLLDAAKLENKGVIALKPESIDIRALVHELAESFELSVKKRGVTFVIDESIESAGTMIADGQMMRHALFNVLSNAIKYTKENTEIIMSYAKENGMHIFRIRDHGNGISVADQVKIFEGYERTDDARQSGQYGSGIGLYLALKATQMHNGTISVESEMGKGSTFVISIPVV